MKSYKFPILALIGIICVILHEIITLTTRQLHVTTISACEVCSMMFMPKPSWLLGLLALPAVGMLGVITFYYLAKAIGTEYLLLKGAIYGMTINAVIFQIFGTLVRNHYMFQSIAGNYIFASSTALAGLVAAILMKKHVYGQENVSWKQVK